MIVYLNNQLSLLRKQDNGDFYPVEVYATPSAQENYELLKNLAHAPTELCLILNSIIQKKNKSEMDIMKMEGLRNRLSQLKALKDPCVLNRMSEILIILEFVNKAISIIDFEKINPLIAKYLEKIEIVNDALSEKSAQLQLEGIHAIICRWKVDYELSFSKIYTIIGCTQGPKKKLIEKQHFQHIYLGQGVDHADEGSYLKCIILQSDQIANTNVEDLVLKWRKFIINRMIGKMMLNDVSAMEEDVLGKKAPKILDSLCPLPVSTPTCRE